MIIFVNKKEEGKAEWEFRDYSLPKYILHGNQSSIAFLRNNPHREEVLTAGRKHPGFKELALGPVLQIDLEHGTEAQSAWLGES